MKRKKKASFAIFLYRGFDYKEIVLFLLQNRDIQMSMATFERRLQRYRLRRRIVVQQLLKEFDSEGTEMRKAHRLKRRRYHNPGPNYSWHCDGYDKLKPYGFPIHGCIDGWSRKILWLLVTRSNNQHSE